MRFGKLLVAVAIGTSLVVGTGVALQARSNSGTSPTVTGSKGAANAPMAFFTNPQKLTATRFKYDAGTASLPAGFAPLHVPNTVSCPGPGACTFGFEEYVQIKGSTDSNSWAICMQVDGAFLSQPPCPFLGQVPNGPFGSGSFTQEKTGLAPGDHTFQTFVYTANGASRGIYNIIVRVYQS